MNSGEEFGAVKTRVVVLFFGIVFYTAQGAVDVPEARLHRDLFKNYNKHSHPILAGTGPVVVTFDFQLIRILDVSAKSQYITTYAWVNQYWQNSLLKWDPKEYGGLEEIHLSPDEVWVPDTLLYNNIDDEQRIGGGRTTFVTNVALRYDGESTWLNPALYKSICGVDMTNFPFDDQECSLKFGSWSFDSSKIDMKTKNDSVINKYYLINGEWKMLNMSVTRHVMKYQCCPHAFVDVTVTVKIRRESLDYILKLIIPCSLISSMIFLGFVLPPESGERIGLSITVLLAMTVFQQLSSELMPSYGFPLLGQFYFATMIEIGASLAVTTLILNFYHRNRRRMPKTMRKVILRWLARILFPFQKPKDWRTVQQSEALRRRCTNSDLENGKNQRSNDPGYCKEDDCVCHDQKTLYSPQVCTSTDDCVLPTKDPTVELCTLRRRPYYTQGGSCKSTTSHNGIAATRCFKKLKWKGDFRKHKKSFRAGKRRSSAARFLETPLTPDFFGGDITESSKEKIKNQKEWIKAARVLDRLFLILSILVSVSTLVTIFLRAPRFSLQL